METYDFIKKQGEWFIVLPEYIRMGGDEADLQMVAGADTMLDLYADHSDEVALFLDSKPFENSDTLTLKQVCTKAEGGGAFYEMSSFRGQPINQVVWLCDVLIFVFRNIPGKIYVKKMIKANC